MKKRLAACLLAFTVTAGVPSIVSGREGPRPEKAIEGATGVAGVDHSGPAVTSSGQSVPLSSVGQRLELGLPGRTVPGTKSASGTTVFPNAVGNADLAVQALDDGGTRTLIKIDGSTAPTSYVFPVSLPAGGRMAVDSAGRVVVTVNGKAVGRFEAPWARDANGKAVPTRYRVQGSNVVQTIAHKGATAYPVVADPWWNPFSWNWSKIWKGTIRIAKSALKKCIGGALYGVLGLGAGTAVTNVSLKYVAKRQMIKVAGGGWAYVGAGAAGCIMNQKR